MVADMVDMFALIVAPGGGDELQGMKKGIVELADLIIVNKADGNLAIPARMAQIEYTSALKYLKPLYNDWKPKVRIVILMIKVLPVSCLELTGIKDVWENMLEFKVLMKESGVFNSKRGDQQVKWMWKLITQKLIYNLKEDKEIMKLIHDFEVKVQKGLVTSGEASETILDSFFRLK